MDLTLDLAVPGLGTISSGITTIFKLAEFGLQLRGVDSDIRELLVLIQTVQDELAEAQRERSLKHALIVEIDGPEKLKYVDKIINHTRKSIASVGYIIEDGRVDIHKASLSEGQKENSYSVTMKHRLQWVLSNKAKFTGQSLAIHTCQTSLVHVTGYMESLSHRSQLNEITMTSTAASTEKTSMRLNPPGLRRPKRFEEPFQALTVDVSGTTFDLSTGRSTPSMI